MSSLRHRFPGARDGWARFDGPAGTQVVDSAITAMTNWLSDGSNGCGGGYFAAALKADELMERARGSGHPRSVRCIGVVGAGAAPQGQWPG